jgi:hypothetical protein
MRYEKPEAVLLGSAESVVLGGDFSPVAEHVMSSVQAALVGYDE